MWVARFILATTLGTAFSADNEDEGPRPHGMLRRTRAHVEQVALDVAAEDPGISFGLLQLHPLDFGIGRFWAIAVISYVCTSVVIYFGLRFGTDPPQKDKQPSIADPFLSRHLSEVSDNEEEDGLKSHQSHASTLLGLQTGTGRRKRQSLSLARKITKCSWQTDTLEERLKVSALTMVIITSTMVVYAFLRFYDRPLCAPLMPIYHLPECVFLAGLLALSVMCYTCPSKPLHTGTLTLLLFYLPMSQLPPFHISCRTLEACKIEGHWRLTQAVRHVDCSLQGQTAQQIFLTVFLLLPWLMIDKRSMHCMWAWIGFVYILWSVAYLRYSPDGPLAFSNEDIMIRSFLLAAALMFAHLKKSILQKSQQNMYTSDLLNRENSRKLYNILAFMLPEHVIATKICQPDEPIAESIDKVTILFIVFDDFDSVVQSNTPEKVLKFLNRYYTQMDQICKQNHVTKIETVGEEYVCAVGVGPDEDPEDHTESLWRLFRAANAIMDLQSEKVRFKMGMHTGPIVAGVIGHKLPRYRLFGDTINTSARMMQKGIVGVAQFGKQTFDILPEDIKGIVKHRGTVEMKGKGDVETWTFNGFPAASIPVPIDSQGEEEDDDDDDEPNGPTPTPRKKKKKVSYAFPQQGHIQRAETVESSVAASMVLTGQGLLHALLKSSHINEDGDEHCSTIQPNRSQHVSTDFGDILDRLKEAQDEAAAGERRRWILSEKSGFTDEMEVEWQEQFHQEEICKKLVPRFDKQALALFVITVVEVLWNTPNPHDPEREGWNEDHDLVPAWARAPVFIALRAVMLGLIMALRFNVTHNTWVWDAPQQFQASIVAVNWVVGLLLYASYDIMIVCVSCAGEPQSSAKLVAPVDQIFSLYFVLIFFLIIRLKMQFYHSLAFIPLTLVIVLCTNMRPHGVYFPFIGQVLFVVIGISNCVLTHYEEQCNRCKFKSRRAVVATKSRVNNILNTMMPPAVMDEIRRAPEGFMPSHPYEHATLAQSDLCGFTALASTRTAREVVQFISELFGKFDDLTHQYGIYKVETIGDAYIAGQAELPLTDVNSPEDVILFGESMVEAVVKWAKNLGVKVKCRVGVHHGACLGGIVGTDMQRYHIFGALMQGLEVLESTAPEGYVQVSPACREAVLREWGTQNTSRRPFKFVEREGTHLTTSKGEIHSYDTVGGRTFVIHNQG